MNKLCIVFQSKEISIVFVSIFLLFLISTIFSLFKVPQCVVPLLIGLLFLMMGGGYLCNLKKHPYLITYPLLKQMSYFLIFVCITGFLVITVELFKCMFM